jgi:hypothetical protein
MKDQLIKIEAHLGILICLVGATVSDQPVSWLWLAYAALVLLAYVLYRSMERRGP